MPALRQIYRRSSMANAGDRELFTRHPEFLEWSDAALREGRTRVAVIDGGIVGFSSMSVAPTNAEVEDLFVAPDWMRRGAGQALVEDMVRAARAAGCLSLEVDANPHAVAFYEAAGFVDGGEVALEHGTARRMRRDISRPTD